MDSRNLLPFLGLCLRGGNLAVGEEPAEAVCRARKAKVLLIASDAAGNTLRRAEHFAQMGNCPCLTLPFEKGDLGRAVGRNSVALAAITDIGLAAAFAERLAALDAEQYGEASETLAKKAERAAQRRAEKLRHEKNLKRGKGRVKLQAPAAETAKPEAAAPPEKQRQKRDPRERNRSGPRARSDPYAHSRPVKKGKGSDRKTER